MAVFGLIIAGTSGQTIKCSDGNENTVYPNNKDCKTYYKCGNGYPILVSCPSDLYYDQRYLTCTYAEFSSCMTTSTSATSTTATTFKPPISSTPAFTCPPNVENVVHPNPKDCETYFMCINGELILTKCPTGLWYDWKYLTCGYPNDVSCEAEIKCPAGNDNAIIPNTKDCTTYYVCKEGTPIPTECPQGLFLDWKRLICTVPEKAICEGRRPTPGKINCPAGSDNAVIPDTKDCTKYYVCKGGNPIPTECSEGLLFDWKVLTCTVPEKAFCEGPRPIQEVHCPAGNDNAIIPNTKDCTKYYVCKGSIPIPAECPQGLFFDWNRLICTVPEKAICDGRRPTPGKINCPAGSDNAVIPDTKDCTKYYACKGGNPISTECSEGLLFDWKVLTCTVAEKAFCEGPRPKPVYPVACPPMGTSDENILLADPKNCHLFYQCVHGEPVSMKCNPGLFWNDRLKVCDYKCVRL